LESANLNTLDGGKGLLYKSKFSKAQLQKADLSGANLKEADLTGAKLQDANLSGANLRGAQFMGVDFNNVLMLYTDLSEAIQLNQEQLEKSNSVFICGSILPDNIKINKTRDCAIMPQVLMKHYPKVYKTLKEAEDFIGSDGMGLCAENEDENNVTEKE
jgi:Pentapeptide repeats (8 copies)